MEKGFHVRNLIAEEVFKGFQVIRAGFQKEI